MPVLHLVVGPHGAGKSTYVARVLRPFVHLPCATTSINLQVFLDARQSFIAETTLGDDLSRDLVDEASSRGYLVHLHVVVVAVELAVGRVADRVRRGGKDVPEQRILEQYGRFWLLGAHARRHADVTEVFDNSSASKPFRLIASYRHGVPAWAPEWPEWLPQ